MRNIRTFSNVESPSLKISSKSTSGNMEKKCSHARAHTWNLQGGESSS
jgi:hypothetical protein